MNAAVSEASAAGKAALEEAKVAAGDYSSPEGLRADEALLQPQTPLLNQALKKVPESQRAGAGEAAKQITMLGTSLRQVQDSVNAELAKIRASKAKAETSEKQRASEEEDSAAYAELLEEVRQAVTQTEQACQEAQKTIGEAIIYLNAKQASSRRFESEKVKQQASSPPADVAGTFAPNLCLSDASISVAYAHLSSSKPESILLMDPMVAFLLGRQDDHKHVEEAKTGFKLRDRELVICPINDHIDGSKADAGTHWTLLVCWDRIVRGGPFRRFSHYDSWGGAANNLAQAGTLANR